MALSVPKKQMVLLFIRGKNTVDFVIPGLDPESSPTKMNRIPTMNRIP
jgi:hypothetical protein